MPNGKRVYILHRTGNKGNREQFINLLQKSQLILLRYLKKNPSIVLFV
jgi:hypothetical protein